MLNKTVKQGITFLALLLALAGCGDKVSNVTSAPNNAPAPQIPQDVQAAAADEKVTIAWRPAPNATSYNIYWKLSPGVTTADNVIVNASSPYVHSGLTNSTAYYYAVAAVNAEGESGLSSEVSATPLSSAAAPAAPAAPANVRLEAAKGRIVVNWDPAPGAESYNVYWATVSGVTTTSNRISAALMPYSHSGLAETTTYYYRVSAVNGAGESALSQEVSTMARLKFSETLRKALAGDAQAGDDFGSSVSLSGDYAIVGAHAEAGSTGAAYIFRRTGPTTWDDGVKLTASDAQAGDHFGISVSISGDYAIVGAYWEAGGTGNPLSYAGAAYIFRRTGLNTWDSGTKLVAPDVQAGDYFGNSVSISGDYAVVGATREDGGAGDPLSDAGAAYIFHRTGVNVWDSGVKLVAPDAQAGDSFGVSLSTNGRYAIVGSQNESGGAGNPLPGAGAAYIFQRTGLNVWDSGVKITAPDAQAEDHFGSTVSIGLDYAVVGAPFENGGEGDPLQQAGAAYVFHRTGTNAWDAGVKLVAPDAQAWDRFGWSVAIDGDRVLAGAPNEGAGALQWSGAAYLFRRTGANVWDNGSKLTASNAQWGDEFGASVALDGDYAVVGAHLDDEGGGNAGAAYFY